MSKVTTLPNEPQPPPNPRLHVVLITCLSFYLFSSRPKRALPDVINMQELKVTMDEARFDQSSHKHDPVKSRGRYESSMTVNYNYRSRVIDNFLVSMTQGSYSCFVNTL